MSKKKLGKGKSKKLSLGQFAWYGFNMTVGIAFLGSLSVLTNGGAGSGTDGGRSGDGLGYHTIWLMTLLGLVAGACAFAFTKLSRHHKADQNGGAYIYSRGSLGRLAGFLTGFLTYLLLPLITANTVLMFFKVFFDPGMAAGGDSSYWLVKWLNPLQNWRSLALDLASILVAAGFTLFSFFGTSIYKKFAKYSLAIKWITTGIMVLFAIVLIVMNGVSNNHFSNATGWTHNGNSQLHIGTFLSGFCACFYYFTGFESYATNSSLLEDPNKMSKGIIIVAIASTLFYIIITILFMLATSTFYANVFTGFWRFFGPAYTDSNGVVHAAGPAHKALGFMFYAGPLIMLVGNIMMRGNLVSQCSIYGGSSLQPLSTEGYISPAFNEVNTEGFPLKAMKLHIIIVLLTLGMWLIVPDIILGITGSTFININTIISATSAFYCCVYMIILASLLNYAFKKVIKVPIWEQIIYITVFIFLLVILVYHFEDLIATAVNTPNVSNIAAAGIEIIFIVAMFTIIFVTYFTYYKTKVQKRNSTDPRIQWAKDSDFRVFDGWKYVKEKLASKLNKFIKKPKKTIYSCNHIYQKAKKDILQYEIYSENVEHYNAQRHIDVHNEIFKNNQEAIETLRHFKQVVNKYTPKEKKRMIRPS